MITRCVYKCIRSGKCEHNRYWYRCLPSTLCASLFRVCRRSYQWQCRHATAVSVLAYCRYCNRTRTEIHFGTFSTVTWCGAQPILAFETNFCWYFSSPFSCVLFSQSFGSRSSTNTSVYLCHLISFAARTANTHLLHTVFVFHNFHHIFFPQFVFRNSDLARRKARVWRASKRARAREFQQIIKKLFISSFRCFCFVRMVAATATTYIFAWRVRACANRFAHRSPAATELVNYNRSWRELYFWIFDLFSSKFVEKK